MESAKPLEMVMLLMLGEIRSCIFFSAGCAAAAAAVVEGELWRWWDKGSGAGGGQAGKSDAGRAFATQNGEGGKTEGFLFVWFFLLKFLQER
jgi:hypothetical protein